MRLGRSVLPSSENTAMRASSAMFARVRKLEQVRGANRPATHWPPILGLDEWEAIAVPSQERLRLDAASPLYGASDIFKNDTQSFGSIQAKVATCG